MSHSKRFDYVKYDERAAAQQQAAKMLMQNVENFIQILKPSQPTRIALTKLEEVYMWIGKAIRDEQVENRSAELQEERNNE